MESQLPILFYYNTNLSQYKNIAKITRFKMNGINFTSSTWSHIEYWILALMWKRFLEELPLQRCVDQHVM